MEKKLGTFEKFISILIVTLFVTGGCGDLAPEAEQAGGGSSLAHNSNPSTGSQTCVVDYVRYPTTYDDFQNLLYGDRGFLAVYNDVKHLGYDVVYAEGTAIHPIACGTVVFYGPASGYGTLVVVIEHKLAKPITITNGDGSSIMVTSFLTIYGHLRNSSSKSGGQVLGLKVGDSVSADDVIGFVQSDVLNGDGPEHLHLGVRVQSASDAKKVDPSAWFRGYDTTGEGTYKKYYTDPKAFIAKTQASHEDVDAGTGNQIVSQAKHFPIGTILEEFGQGYWLVVNESQILDVTNYGKLPTKCAVRVQTSALTCYEQVTFDPISLYLDAKVVKFDGEPQVYQLFPGNGFEPTGYRTFLSYDSFLSWGYQDSDIVNYPVTQKGSILGALQDKGKVGFFPGALVKGKGESEVSVADQVGKRRPIFNWDVFQALGYRPECIFEIEPTTLDLVAGQRSDQLITLAETSQCGPTGAGGSSGSGGAGGSVGSCDSQDYCSCPEQRACVGNETQLCACPGGKEGVQICMADCSGWELCQCPSANNGGSGGSSGYGGSPGFGGSPGSGGTINAGGSSSGGFGGSGGSNIDAGSGSGICQQKGIAGQTTFIIQAPVGPNKVLSVGGWIDYPGWSGALDLSWHGWAWGTPGNGELVFQKGEAYQGTRYIFAPGTSPAPGQPQDAWYCDQTSCPIGTFIVCDGLEEACRVQNGILSGGASYTPNQSNWQNIQCVLP
jgi:murein DD-endopeptidase MepM/ murein hydrolase activator NlpD